MHYFFKQHEENFKKWRNSGYQGISQVGVNFLKHLGSRNFKPDLKAVKFWNEKQWKKVQLEAIERCVYSFEVLGEKDLLTNIVTGGGKTTIIGALIAYMMIVHNQYKFLILTPNTIVRERLDDEFDTDSPTYIYNVFPFFFNSFETLKTRISLYKMQPTASAAGIRSGTIILGNIHQIYERTENKKVLMKNIDKICIFNDEAHNTKAEQYDKLLYEFKIKDKRFFRLDTTATPDRLDGSHPDSKMIFVYDIAQALADKIIKRPIVFHPDIRKVKLTYEDLETGKTISAEEVPWEEIEKRKIPARRYITSLKPMRQQIAIACELLKEQVMRTPKPYKPLLFLITFSIEDAKNIARELEKIGGKYGIKKILLVHNKQEEELKKEARDLNKNPQTKYDAVVSVLMLREGWDVRNISVVLLFRKFCYKEVDGQKFSVYGPQVIGRGLRRMSKSPDQWEMLFIVDHPILKHKWLWDNLRATQYPDVLDPSNIIIDEKKIPQEKNAGKIDEGEKTLENAAEETFDRSKWGETPGPPEILEPIYEWQKFLDEHKYDFNRINIEQDIEKIKSLNIETEHVTMGKADIPEVEVQKIAKATRTEDWSIEELKKQLVKQVHLITKYALLEYDRNPDERQVVLVKIIRDHIKKRLLSGSDIEDSTDEALLSRLWAIIDQVRDIFMRPELIEGIFTSK
ncbi:DEAD/DEAH box helicase family protein [Patescibacteria group bacterium]|nr:DEAD/DEAH box helicase family protein [Patescibacteria group bacterium]